MKMICALPQQRLAILFMNLSMNGAYRRFDESSKFQATSTREAPITKLHAVNHVPNVILPTASRRAEARPASRQTVCATASRCGEELLRFVGPMRGRKTVEAFPERQSRAGVPPARVGEADAMLVLAHSRGRRDACPTFKERILRGIFILLLGATSLFADEMDTNSGKSFYVGKSSFPRGDAIEITSVERSETRMMVRGHYQLVSADRAKLAFYTTTKEAISVPTDQTQLLKISKGQGDFELIHPNLVPGWNHVTMYSVPGGKPFAGVYFGTKEEAAEESNMRLAEYDRADTDASASNRNQPPREERASASGPNQVLLEYLGNPIQPLANMDARYTKDGLTQAIQLAARNAGIAVKKVTVDDSEYPFVVAVACGGSDFPKLKDQIRKLAGYEYNGSIGNDSNSDGSDTCNVFSIVPYSAYPQGTDRQIGHRLMLREQVFYDKINGRD